MISATYQVKPRLLNCPKAIAPKAVTFRYFVEVVSEELDEEGITLQGKMLDVVVTEPGRKPIEQLMAATSWLKGYRLLRYWIPEDNCPF